MLDQMFRRAERTLLRGEVKLEDFLDIYGEGEIAKDKAYVEGREKIFSEQKKSPQQEETHKLATVFEGIMFEHGELSDWFGPDVETKKTSRYDDIRNGVDTVIEFADEEKNPMSHLALAVDVTFSSNTQDKFDRIRREIESDELAQVKYFDSRSREPLLAPRFVVGADPRTVKELGELWIEGKKRELGGHRVQLQILEEILYQAEAFGAYAEKQGSDKVSMSYRKVEQIIRDILAEKQRSVEDSGERDNIFFYIKSTAEQFADILKAS